MVRLKPWLFLALISTEGFGQSFLLLQKNKRRQAYYQIGDKISFKIRGESKITDRIKAFEEGLIVFQGYQVRMDEIADLYVDDKTKIWFVVRYKYEKALPVAGAGYLLLDAINTKTLNKNALLTGGALVGAGLLAKYFISKKFKIRGKRKIIIHKAFG